MSRSARIMKLALQKQDKATSNVAKPVKPVQQPQIHIFQEEKTLRKEICDGSIKGQAIEIEHKSNSDDAKPVKPVQKPQIHIFQEERTSGKLICDGSIKGQAIEIEQIPKDSCGLESLNEDHSVQNCSDDSVEDDSVEIPIEQVTNNKLLEEDALHNNDIQEKGDENDLAENSRNGVYISAASHFNGKRVYDKRHYCLYCDKPYIKMARHLESVHAEEIGVGEVLAKDKGSLARRQSFNNIIKVGDFHHNIEVLTLKKGELVLVRRPPENETTEVKDFGPCPQCLGFMHKRHLWHHSKKCIKTKPTESESKLSICLESNALLNSILSDTTKHFQDCVLNHLSNDEVSEVVKADDIITRFGSFMFDKFGSTQNELIRQSMRQLGRLLIVLQKKTTKDKHLSSFLQPRRFDAIVEGVRELCIEDREGEALRPQFKIPSLAMKLGYHLKKCASLLRGVAIRKGNTTLDTKLQSFLTLMEMEWSTRISSNAISTLVARKRNAVDLLPLTTDLMKLTEYCKTQMRTIRLKLKGNPEPSNWSELAKVTLSRLVVFNKRRGGETAKLLVDDYNNRRDWAKESTQEMQSSLSSFELDLAGKLTLIQVTGKRGRTVPLLIPKDVNKCIRLLLKTREAVGIHKDNPYVFSSVFSNSNKHLRGNDCLRKVCTDAQLEMPQNINSTRLRKYIATVCQIFSLKENEMGWLARHLGHELNVHREFYSLHDSAVELAKISRLLMVVDQGAAHQFAGKTLEEITLEDLPQIDVDDNEGDKEDPNEELSEGLQTTKVNDKTTFGVQIPKKPRRVAETVSDSTEKLPNRRNTAKRPWSEEEKAAVLTFLRQWLKKGIVPRKEDCMKCIAANASILKKRTWKDVKFCIKNQIDKMKRVTNRNIAF